MTLKRAQMKIFGHTSDDFGTQNHIAVHVKPGRSVSLSRSQLIRGRNHHSGKTWARWQLESRSGFWRTDTGTICAYTKYGTVWRSAEAAFSLIDKFEQNPFMLRETPTYTAERLFVENVREQFNIKTFTDVYPIAGLKELRNFDYIPRTLTTPSRATDIMTFTRRVFGVRNYRKDLVRQVAGASLAAISVAREFRGLVPADWLVQFLANSTAAEDYKSNVDGLREILRSIDPRSYRRMLFRPFSDQDFMYLADMTNMYRSDKKRVALGHGGYLNIPRNSFASFSEFHDRTIGHRGYGFMVHKPYENEPIKLTTIAGYLHGTKVDGYVVMCAMDTDDLKFWGDAMHSCIGGYTNTAMSGRDVFGAVFKDDVFIANFQIDGWGTLVQLLGQLNEPLPDVDREKIEEIFIDNSVKVPHSYMGKPYVYNGPIAEATPIPLALLGTPLEETDPFETNSPSEFEILLAGLQLNPPL